LLAACKTTSPSGARVTAAVEIQGRSPAEIRLVTLDVFRTNGYSVTLEGAREMVFEKPASTMSALAYGGLDDLKVWMRARVTITDIGSGRHALDCDAKYVRNRGESVFEDEQGGVGQKPFKTMLKDIKGRVEGGW
jgi:hypothetical protein